MDSKFIDMIDKRKQGVQILVLDRWDKKGEQRIGDIAEEKRVVGWWEDGYYNIVLNLDLETS